MGELFGQYYKDQQLSFEERNLNHRIHKFKYLLKCIIRETKDVELKIQIVKTITVLSKIEYFTFADKDKIFEELFNKLTNSEKIIKFFEAKQKANAELKRQENNQKWIVFKYIMNLALQYYFNDKTKTKSKK